MILDALVKVFSVECQLLLTSACAMADCPEIVEGHSEEQRLGQVPPAVPQPTEAAGKGRKPRAASKADKAGDKAADKAARIREKLAHDP